MRSLSPQVSLCSPRDGKCTLSRNVCGVHRVVQGIVRFPNATTPKFAFALSLISCTDSLRVYGNLV